VKLQWIEVNDLMQKDYRYALAAREGQDFDRDFRPDLTPPQLLALGIFGGKYMTDCRGEFPEGWFAEARLSQAGKDPSLNFFGVGASQPLSVVSSEPTLSRYAVATPSASAIDASVTALRTGCRARFRTA